MTEVPKPLDTALDLFVYAPVGLALTAAEELPKLAAKGRTRVGGQIAMARVVGQFAVTRGRQELEKRFNGPPPAASDRLSAGGDRAPTGGDRPPSGGDRAPAGGDRPRAGSDRSAVPGGAARSKPAGGSSTNGAGPRPQPDGSGPPVDPSDAFSGAEVVLDTAVLTVSTAGDLDRPARSGHPGPAEEPQEHRRTSPSPRSAPVPGVSELAIPGYDSLSASQVVQRLAGLERGELEAVAAYEAAQRGRRTILNRIQQLTAG